MKLIEFIPYGRANAISMRTLSKRRGVDPRTLRLLIQREREQGAPICSNWEQGGYFMSANKNEARIYYRQQRSRIRSAIAALNGVKRYLRGGGDDE